MMKIFRGGRLLALTELWVFSGSSAYWWESSWGNGWMSTCTRNRSLCYRESYWVQQQGFTFSFACYKKNEIADFEFRCWVCFSPDECFSSTMGVSLSFVETPPKRSAFVGIEKFLFVWLFWFFNFENFPSFHRVFGRFFFFSDSMGDGISTFS